MLAALTEFIDKDEVYALSTMVEAQIEQSQVRRLQWKFHGNV